ncbi:MAG: cobalamin-independent methionine synthase II family protein [Chloroflexota bacterium]|nr:cobalamin-independent methionine synthase II family protein [Chloroflexota bacterium]MDE2910254.1 cobalamin-independent methionine synthase II family protein [Chloroflexota bacterium]
MTADTLFPTSVIGSLPRPKWVIDLLIAHQDGLIDDEALDDALDRAITYAIGLQEAAGIDIISDGEWRRIGYFEVFAQMVDGFRQAEYQTQALAPDVLPDTGLSPPQQWTLQEFKQALVVEPMMYARPIAAQGAGFLQQSTKRMTKVALPSPHMIGGRLWHAEYSSGAYPTRRDFIEAVIPILRAEVAALSAAGVDVIQFDDPWLCFFVDPEHRARFDDPDAEIEQAIDDLNRVLAGIDGVKTALHVCRGNRARTVYANGDYEPIMPHLLRAEVDQLAMEFAVSQAGDVAIFEQYPTEKEIGLGVVDVRGEIADTPELIVERVEKALRYLAPEQITLNPDCGFAPTSTNPISLEEAYQKLKAMAQAAEILRHRYV